MKRLISLAFLIACCVSLLAGNAAAAPSAVSGVQPKAFSEAPMLAAKVKTGELPPLEKRLPREPLVQVGPEGNGSYDAGPLRVLSNENSKLGDGRNAISVASFVLPDFDGATLLPNLAKSWSYSPDFRVLTINFRQGVKWSDGVEFTTEDIRFWWEDVMNNTDLNKSVDTRWITAGGPMKVEIVDKYTIKFICSDPNPDLISKTIEGAMSGQVMYGTYYPAHWSKRFHKKYANAAELDALVKGRGLTDWKQLFLAMNAAYWDPQIAELADQPTLNSHRLAKIGPNYIELERNPYYWKVDSEGRQLPYIDKIYVQIVSSNEIYQAKAATGEADFAARRTKASELAVYKNGEAAGKFRVRIWQAVGDGDYVLMMNFNDLDPVKRELIQNLEFRKAISTAIDRDEFNKNRSYGLGIPSQIPMPGTSKFMENSFATANAKFDVAAANKALDALGLKWDANREYRLRKDGKRLSFDMINGGERPIEGDELLAAQLRKVGIEVKPQLLARELYESRLGAGNFDFHMRKYGMLDNVFMIWPDMALPIKPTGVDVWAPAWANWRVMQVTDVKPSNYLEEPPALVKKLIARWEESKSLSPSSPEYVAIGKELLKAQSENLWTIGILTGGPQPVIVSNRMGNVLEKGIYTYDYLIYAQYSRADSWFIKK